MAEMRRRWADGHRPGSVLQSEPDPRISPTIASMPERAAAPPVHGRRVLVTAAFLALVICPLVVVAIASTSLFAPAAASSRSRCGRAAGTPRRSSGARTISSAAARGRQRRSIRQPGDVRAGPLSPPARTLRSARLRSDERRGRSHHPRHARPRRRRPRRPDDRSARAARRSMRSLASCRSPTAFGC